MRLASLSNLLLPFVPRSASCVQQAPSKARLPGPRDETRVARHVRARFCRRKSLQDGTGPPSRLSGRSTAKHGGLRPRASAARAADPAPFRDGRVQLREMIRARPNQRYRSRVRDLSRSHRYLPAKPDRDLPLVSIGRGVDIDTRREASIGTGSDPARPLSV